MLHVPIASPRVTREPLVEDVPRIEPEPCEHEAATRSTPYSDELRGRAARAACASGANRRLRARADLAAQLAEDAAERFLRYVRIDTQSDEDSETYPSTAKQLDLLRLLLDELRELGLEDAAIDEHGYVTATHPGDGRRTTCRRSRSSRTSTPRAR